jgi:site-specific recombinase XerD
MDVTQVSIIESQSVSAWQSGQSYTLTVEQMIAAWLNAKTSRSGSEKTRRAYADTLQSFRVLLLATGLDLFSDQVSLLALAMQGYAGKGAAGHEVSSSTYNQKLAILSSFYSYAIKHGATKENPVILVERRAVATKHAALPLATSTVKSGLSSIDRTAIEGLRDYALLSLALATGRRASELAHLQWNDIRTSSTKMVIIWQRCKGNKQMSDEIKPKTRQALEVYLHAFYGASLGVLNNDAPVFVSLSRNNYGGTLSIQAISDICKKHLGTSKVHATRHTFAIGMEEAGAKLSDIGARLGHSDLKTTSKYMERLHSAENIYGDRLEDMFGI